MRYILQRTTTNSEVTPIERGLIITYRRNFGFDNKNFFFEDKLMSEKKKKEMVKMVDLWATGMENRLGGVSQSKEHQKLGCGQKMSYET